MEWIAQNWVWIVFAVAFVAIHLFGHGGHGGHGGHHGGARAQDDSGAVGGNGERRRQGPSSGHQL